MKVGIVDSGSQKAYLYDNSTGKIIPWDGIIEITDEKEIMIELDKECHSMVEKLNECISFSTELSSVEKDSYKEKDYDTRQKPNPVYVPKHISRRRKW